MPASSPPTARMRLTMEKKTPHPARQRKPEKAEIDAIRDALYASKIIAYAQGFEQMSVASAQFKWDLKLGDMATIWRGGCIIRARFLDRIKEAYERNPKLANLLLDDYFPSARKDRGRLAAGDRARGREWRARAGLFFVARLLRRSEARPRTGEPAPGSARLFRRPHLPPSRQGRQFPYPLEPGRQRGQDVTGSATAASRIFDFDGRSVVRKALRLGNIIDFLLIQGSAAPGSPVRWWLWRIRWRR